MTAEEDRKPTNTRKRITEELPTAEYETSKGRRIIRLSINTLPRLYNSVYVVFLDDKVFLVDLGFSFDIHSFINKFQKEITQKYSVDLEDVYGIVITHGHIDHFGGIYKILKFNPRIKVFIHEIDSKAVEKVKETYIYAKHYFRIFLKRAGLDEKGIETYINIYSSLKEYLEPIRVTRPLKDNDNVEAFSVIHTPGHSPGHVCLLLDDVLFTGDHILPHITPHQFPESIMKYTGIGHYLESLAKIQEFVLRKKVSFGLPGHYEIIEDVYTRAEEIKKHHFRRFKEVMEVCRKPKTIVDIVRELFPDKENYQFILALDEVGAHVEYLWDRGYLSIGNIQEFIENDEAPAFWVCSRDDIVE